MIQEACRLLYMIYNDSTSYSIISYVKNDFKFIVQKRTRIYSRLPNHPYSRRVLSDFLQDWNPGLVKLFLPETPEIFQRHRSELVGNSNSRISRYNQVFSNAKGSKTFIPTITPTIWFLMKTILRETPMIIVTRTTSITHRKLSKISITLILLTQLVLSYQ